MTHDMTHDKIQLLIHADSWSHRSGTKLANVCGMLDEKRQHFAAELARTYHLDPCDLHKGEHHD